MRSATIVLVLGAAILGGCGGGSTKTVTISGSGNSTETTSTSNNPPETPTRSPGQQFETFLVRIRPIRHAGNVQSARCNRLYHEMSTSGYVGWTAAGNCSLRAQRVESNVADRLAAITPPASLRRVFLAYARSWRTDAEIYRDLASTIDHHNYLDWNRFNARFNAPNDRDAVAAFRVALIAYGAAHGYWVPKWVHTIGG
jgi:hypothetical protein